MGFGKLSDDVKRRNGNVSMRRWVCSREGFRRDEWLNMPIRKKRSKPITRTGCQEDTNGLLAQVCSINLVGIRTSQIMLHVAIQSGGYERIPCQVRDVYNKVVGSIRHEKLETDAEGALEFLDCMSSWDPNFCVYHQPDEENWLGNVFWADGTARKDYTMFSDVVAFDTTYMRNVYTKPLCILKCVNHHFSTYVFGFALLVDEKTTTYSLMLRVFIQCHDDKNPLVVITNGENEM
ncbi:protein FAR1-RELATED SEQUENCE 5-like [Humulus lupulus]|uniref:protein FAR1-RELATED SEQUENCE 5-like n=1 Tax=Humulus lupulus TaxID=3486 RepID=UPI002B408F2E|nr:protein FAR1-RELATED SEQUENCE 5-like [Humulus lupulus]